VTKDSDALRRAIEAATDGDLVVYPTETVYGLGGDALDPAAVERVFELKGRERSNPLSLGVPSVDAALRYTNPTEFAVAFARAFLPGPVTVIVERGDAVPDALTAGRDRVGIRVPDHAVARELLGETGPLTATSANVSGRGSVTHPDDLDDRNDESSVHYMIEETIDGEPDDDTSAEVDAIEESSESGPETDRSAGRSTPGKPATDEVSDRDGDASPDETTGE